MSNTVETPPNKVDLPVEIIGADANGRQFLERTRTISVHKTGVSVALASELQPDTQVIVRNPDNSEEAMAVVVGRAPGDTSGIVYGLAFVEPNTDLWKLQFSASGPAKVVHLQCTGCGSVCTLLLSDIDLEIFGNTRELLRSCATCNSLGIWRETSMDARTKKMEAAPAPQANTGSIPSASEDRRKNRRTTMKMAACVRFSGIELVVDCEDVSKGGFRFKSQREYPQGTLVETAVPFTKSSNNIFGPATISYCQKTPDGKFRHGVTYIKSRSTF